jgi:hypothetical protein
MSTTTYVQHSPEYYAKLRELKAAGYTDDLPMWPGKGTTLGWFYLSLGPILWLVTGFLIAAADMGYGETKPVTALEWGAFISFLIWAVALTWIFGAKGPRIKYEFKWKRYGTDKEVTDTSSLRYLAQNHYIFRGFWYLAFWVGAFTLCVIAGIAFYWCVFDGLPSLSKVTASSAVNLAHAILIGIPKLF